MVVYECVRRRSDVDRDSARALFVCVWCESQAPKAGYARAPIWQRLTAVKIEAEMYKTSVVLFILLHLFIFFHLPQPTPTAAMSVNERTYIMVKVRKSRR